MENCKVYMVKKSEFTFTVELSLSSTREQFNGNIKLNEEVCQKVKQEMISY